VLLSLLTPFEIDGNAVDNTPGGGTGVSPDKEPAPDDWANIFRSLGSSPGSSDGNGDFDHAVARAFVADPEAGDKTYFTGGGSKDIRDIPDWQFAPRSAPDKDELTNAYVAGYIDPANNHGYVYFGADRFDTSGSGQMGFWFFRNSVSLPPNTSAGHFTVSGSGLHVAGSVNFSSHTVTGQGDMLILTDFTQGGGVPTVKVYLWVGSMNGKGVGDSDTALFSSTPASGYKADGPLQLLFDSQAAGTTDVNGDGAADVTAQVNTGTATSPWLYTDKNGLHNFAQHSFFEGGVDLTSLGLGSGCISSFLAESRSSGSATTAQLKDFALGAFNFCFVEVEGGTDVSKVGDVATYTIQMTNSGALPIYLKDVTDAVGGTTLLGNIVLNGVVQAPPAGETFNVPAGALDGLASGETQTITVTRITQAGDPDPIVTKTNAVFNSKPDFTGDPITHDPATNTVDLFAPAVQVTKSADKTAAKLGDLVTYTYTITNKTDGDLTTPALDSTAPNLVLDTSGTHESLLGDAALIAAIQANGLDNLSLGESGSFTLSHTVVAADYPGPLNNTVAVLYHPTPFPNPITSDASVSVHLVDASIALSPLSATNEVGHAHTITATVNQVIDGATSPAANGTVVVFSLANSNGATASFVADGVDSNGDGNSGNDAVVSDGLAPVQIISSAAGTVTVNATTTFLVGGVSLTRDTDPATGTVSGPGGSGPATKVFVDARISIAPSATNEVGQTHTFIVTVEENAGTGAGFVAAAGESVTVALTAQNGAVLSNVSPQTGTTDGSGQFQVSFTSNSAGQVIGNATAGILVGGLTLPRDTDPATATIGSGPGGSGPATKTFVNASIALSPLTAQNMVFEPHTVTATVKQDDGLTAAQGGDGVSGLANAPDGTMVVFIVDPGTATLTFTDPNLDSDNNPLTAKTSGGQAALEFTSSTPGTVTINASTTFSVGGVSMTRDTNPSTVDIPSGPGGSGPATKVFIGFPDVHIHKVSQTLAGDPITGPIQSGDSFKYVLTVTNDGNAVANDVTVTDDLDNRLSVISVTPSQGSADPVGAGNFVTIHLGSLGIGLSATMTIVVDTPAEDPTTPQGECIYTQNVAHVTASNEADTPIIHLTDDVPNNNNVPDDQDNTSETVIVSTTSTEQTITFDPDGAGPLLPMEVAVFDQSPGNSLAINSQPGINTVAGADFRQVFQSKLSNLLDENFNTLHPAGLGTVFQILTESNFTAHGSSPAPGFTLLSDPTGPGPNEFRLIYHPIGTALNDRTGAGFAFNAANGDQVILTGHISGISGSGSTDNSTSSALDQAAGAPPAGPTNPPTLNLSGSAHYFVLVDFANADFFPDETAELTQLAVSTLNAAPFRQVGANSGTFYEGTSRNIGATNGLSGPDVEFQTDENAALTALCVPVDEAGNPHPEVLGLSAGSSAAVARSVVGAPSGLTASTTKLAQSPWTDNAYGDTRLPSAPTMISVGAQAVVPPVLFDIPLPNRLALAGNLVDSVLGSTNAPDVLDSFLNGIVPRPRSLKRGRR
jgi:uncharacterized repeat protein (TIGR01451 family)